MNELNLGVSIEDVVELIASYSELLLMLVVRVLQLKL